MSIISPTFIHPNINNRSDVIELFEELKQIYNYYDVSSKVVEIIERKNVGSLGLIRSYTNFSSLASVFPKLRENSRFQELNLKIFEKQFGETTTNGQIWLTVFGSRNLEFKSGFYGQAICSFQKSSAGYVVNLE